MTTEPSKRAMDSGAPTGIVVGPNPGILLRGVAGIHVYHAMFFPIFLRRSHLGLLHCLCPMDPVESRAIMDSTKRYIKYNFQIMDRYNDDDCVELGCPPA